LMECRNTAGGGIPKWRNGIRLVLKMEQVINGYLR